MHPADIDINSRCIKKRSTGSNASVEWASVTTVTLCRLPSLVDETGMVLQTTDSPGHDKLYVRETQPGYPELFAALDIEAQLPVNWYAEVEVGETFTVQANASTASG